MQTTRDTGPAAQESRWTPGWIVLISALTPASAWVLHTVGPELVPWYLGSMAWLVFTPERRPRWLTIHATAGAATLVTPTKSANLTGTALTPRDGQALDASSSATTADQTASADSTNGKAKKARTRARKPKAVTLAEMKSLTGGADRAVVWSQVGPGKFVRQPGEENGETEGEAFENLAASSEGGTMVIDTIATETQNMDMDEE